MHRRGLVGFFQTKLSVNFPALRRIICSCGTHMRSYIRIYIQIRIFNPGVMNRKLIPAPTFGPKSVSLLKIIPDWHQPSFSHSLPAEYQALCHLKTHMYLLETVWVVLRELIIFFADLLPGYKPFMPLIYYGPTNHQHVATRRSHPVSPPADPVRRAFLMLFEAAAKKKINKYRYLHCARGSSKEDVGFKFDSVAST